MKKLKKDVQGITLIALVVTIIVLLILASVALNLTIGQNGIFTRATKTSEETRYATLQEEITMELSGRLIDEEGEGNSNEIEEYLNNISGATIEKSNYVDDIHYVSKNDVVVTVYDDGTIEKGKIDVWDGESYEKPVVDENKNWHIYNCEQMIYFAKYCNNELSAEEKAEMPEITSETTVYLENNIDMGARQVDGVLKEGTAWTPINMTTGTFDGKEHSISGIYVKAESYVGTFRFADYLKNLFIKNSYIEASDQIAGGICAIGSRSSNH